MFEKLYKYIGKNIKTIIDRHDEPYVLRLQKNRVFYVKEALMRRATNVRPFRVCLQVVSRLNVPWFLRATTPSPPPQVARDKLQALGTQIGKFTHGGNFHLTIGVLDILGEYAKYKVMVPW